MNAYKLADELQDLHGLYCEDAANMLRQQADRIAELEKELYFKNYYEELPDTPVGIIGKIGDSPIHDLVHRTTPQIKELSDEEIGKIYNKVKADSLIEHTFPYKFAHAIQIALGIVEPLKANSGLGGIALKKASEK
jgi:hypothetical protein